MHDCVKTRELLVDLVFDEPGSEAGARALLELEGCPDCLAQYRSMAETLRVFDQVTETIMPEEDYWPGYEARLGERLRHERRNWKRRLADWIGGFKLAPPAPLTPGPLTVAAGMALVLLVIGLWAWQRRHSAGPSTSVSDVARQTPTPAPKLESPDEVIVNNPKPAGITKKRPPVRRLVRREEQGMEIAEGVVVSREPDQSIIAASLYTPETVRHFEKAQLMLRSFRNASAAKRSAAPDLAYERQMSRRLLYQNILLRRDAEMKGNLPAEEALSNLEPFLLDIANLPDNPSTVELGGIRERLRRKELIASLQISSASSRRIP